MTYLKQAFGQNLRLLRKARGLTQEQLSELINLNQRQLTRVESGDSFVSSTVLEKLVVALNVDIKTLFDFKLKEVILNKTGTDDNFHYKIIKTDNVIRLQKINTLQKTPQIEEEKIIESAPDEYLINTAKMLNTSITAQYLKDKRHAYTYIYHPNGKIDLIKAGNVNTEENKNIEKLLDKIKKIAANKQQVNYINLAFESLSNKTARQELKMILNGMDLVD